ncbi:hypothetical protein BKA69DRAFT_1104552 [Paraphysoderma sedebokerense]|nr:hypothetical protein BKA69DRAFT_1104552 [Paraphysoderma sedebokerense]
MYSKKNSTEILSSETPAIPNETKLVKKSHKENILLEDPVDDVSGMSCLLLPRDASIIRTRSFQIHMQQLLCLRTTDTRASLDKKRYMFMSLPPSIVISSDYIRGQGRSRNVNAAQSSYFSLDRVVGRKIPNSVLDLRGLATLKTPTSRFLLHSEDATTETGKVQCDTPPLNPDAQHELQHGEKVIMPENEPYSATGLRDCDPAAITTVNECPRHVEDAKSKSRSPTRNIVMSKFRTLKESCKAFRRRVKRMLKGKFKTREEL